MCGGGKGVGENGVTEKKRVTIILFPHLPTHLPPYLPTDLPTDLLLLIPREVPKLSHPSPPPSNIPTEHRAMLFNYYGRKDARDD